MIQRQHALSVIFCLFAFISVATGMPFVGLSDSAHVLLKDGRTFIGTIRSQTDEVIVIKNVDGVRTIPMSLVKSVERFSVENSEGMKFADSVPNRSALRDTVFLENSYQDGRGGFIIGVGLGLGSSSLSAGSSNNSEAGLAIDFKIGHAPTDQVAIYLTGKGASYPSKSADVTTIVGVGCIGGTYYFQPSAPSPFASFGLGSSFISSSSDSKSLSVTSTTQGFGVFFGGGYEFVDHWDVEVAIMFGSPTKGSEYFGFKVTINVLSY